MELVKSDGSRAALQRIGLRLGGEEGVEAVKSQIAVNWATVSVCVWS